MQDMHPANKFELSINPQFENMKTKSFLLAVSLLTMTVIGAQAQGFHLGIKAGANMDKIAGQSFNDGYKLGYGLGAYAQLNFSKTWGIQPELTFNQSQTTTTTDFNLIYHGYYGQNITLNYMNIPILLNFSPSPLLTFQAGPQFGILISEPKDLGNNISNAFKNGNFSMVGGAQVNLGAFKVGARYVVGLNNINDISDQDKWTNQSLQFYLALRII